MGGSVAVTSRQGVPATLGGAAKRRGVGVILVDTFFMWGGFFMVVPLISVHYVEDRGFAVAAVGLVLAVRQMVQQGLTLVGGILADRLGAKGLICAGLLIRGLGFAAMARADTLPILFLTAIGAALGGALFEAPRSAALAALVAEEDRARVYALAGTVGGLGTTVGTFAGAALLRVDFALVALVSGGCFLLTTLITALFLPPVRVATGERKLTAGVGLALRDRPFVIFTVLLMGYWFMWVQLTISLPLEARALSGTNDAVSWLYGLNAGMTIVLQYPLLRLAGRRLGPLPILIGGMALMALGLGSVPLAGSVAGLLGAVALFSVGAVLATPTQQTVLAGLANPAALGSYFGVSALALAFGGGLGTSGGGFLYGLGQRLGLPALPWLAFCGVGLAATVGLLLFHRSGERRRAPADAPVGERVVALERR